MIDRPVYKCDFPGCKVFTFYRSNLFEHKKIKHDKIFDFECHCGKKFAFLHQLNAHKKVAHGENEYVCDFCGKSFSSVYASNYHSKYDHGPKKPIEKYPCEVCGLLLNKKAMVPHMKIHGAPQHACQHCDRKFIYKDSLLDHQEKHMKLAHPCPHDNCTRTFRKPSGLKDHLKRGHKKDKKASIKPSNFLL
jgi:KRAB domain-containing zinc finger protein